MFGAEIQRLTERLSGASPHLKGGGAEPERLRGDPGAVRRYCRPVMAPPVEGGGARYPGQGGGGGGGRPNAIRIATGAPIGAQACSPTKPFKQPSAMSAGSSIVPQMSKASTTSLPASIGNGAHASQVRKAARAA